MPSVESIFWTIVSVIFLVFTGFVVFNRLFPNSEDYVGYAHDIGDRLERVLNELELEV